ncbi:MAG: DUF1501 domain-containing protein [Planctomycetaceae bacterium]|nr:DUF1501 domain-containing protein [Planctomycetaceae bacterium]
MTQGGQKRSSDGQRSPITVDGDSQQPLPLSSRPSRRQLLQTGAIGALGLTLPELLAEQSVNPATTQKTPKSCIFIYQYGGLSQLDSWDPKPQGPAEIRGPYRPIATATPGFQIGELMPRLALLSADYAVIRSMTHHVPVHNVANQMLLAGRRDPQRDSPSFGSIVTKLHPSSANVPSHVWLQKFGGGAAPPDESYLTGGFLGMPFAPMLIGEGHTDNPATPGYQVQAFETASDVSLSRLQSRWQLLQQVDRSDRSRGSLFGKMHGHQERAYELLHGTTARQAFEVDREPDPVRDQYGRHPLGQNLLLARRLIESGVRLVNVVAWMGLAPNENFVSVETWDMHGNAGVSIFDNGWNGLGWALPRADAAVATLLEDLKARGLLESTLVVLVGEFGRTPRISQGAKAIGRDHWPQCYSAMIAGAGIRGGMVYGTSDSQAAWVASDPVSPEDFTATLLHAMDLDPATRLSPDGFTRPASTGNIIHDLF